MDAIGPRVGMCHCPSCDTFACRWCWAAYRGACPTCRDPFVVPTSAGVAVLARIGATRRRVQRAPLAFSALVASIAVLALTLGGQFRPAGGTESPTRPPIAEAGGSFAPSAGVVPSGDPTASARGSAHPTGSTKPTQTATGGGGAPGDDPTTRPTSRVAGATATPTPTPTPRGPKPPPTPRPTPPPTPPPTPAPTPTPTPACETVPTLVGETVAAARAAWAAAGFTGAFVPVKGHDNTTVLTQSHPAGACLPPATSIEVTYARP
jgi:hypothetical protein